MTADMSRILIVEDDKKLHSWKVIIWKAMDMRRRLSEMGKWLSLN